jgi:alkylation response protein AidB-like acyl-CoA dehydrogenase
MSSLALASLISMFPWDLEGSKVSSEASELPTAAATARVSATKAFYECSKENIQTHGGMGATWEFDCHLFYRRSRLLASNIGSQGVWKEKLISSIEKSNLQI